jgi:hypothetical protein
MGYAPAESTHLYKQPIKSDKSLTETVGLNISDSNPSIEKELTQDFIYGIEIKLNIWKRTNVYDRQISISRQWLIAWNRPSRSHYSHHRWPVDYIFLDHVVGNKWSRIDPLECHGKRRRELADDRRGVAL